MRTDMAFSHFTRGVLRIALATGLCVGATAAGIAQQVGVVPLALDSGRVSIAGTSNIHEYTASTTSVRITRVHVATSASESDLWTQILTPGALDAFEVAIPAATLASPKEGLDKNMRKALKVQEHPDITFRLTRLEARAGTAGALRGVGLLRIAGVEREVALDITTARNGSTLSVRGAVQLLMTDFGVTPPTAMLGMLKTDPKVTVTFETVLAIPLT
jgi:polyisoprenoid-binding protein YceI